MTARATGSIGLATAILGTAVAVGASMTVLFGQVRERDTAWSAPAEAVEKVNRC